jgi:hypothetical protein
MRKTENRLVIRIFGFLGAEAQGPVAILAVVAIIVVLVGVGWTR